MSELRQDTEEITANWLPSVQAVGAIDTQTAELRLTILAHLLSMQESEMAALEKQSAEGRTQLGSLRKRYESLISSPEEKKTYDEFGAIWSKYVAVNDRALELSRSNDKAGATVIMMTESRPLYRSSKAVMEKLVKLNEEGVAHVGKASADGYLLARNVLLGVATMSIVLAVVAAWWLIRSITAPLATAVAVADRVASGDLSGQISVTSRDETGQLLSALQRMQQSLVRTVSAVRQNAEGVASASAQIASGNNDLSSRTEQ